LEALMLVRIQPRQPAFASRLRLGKPTRRVEARSAKTDFRSVVK